MLYRDGTFELWNEVYEKQRWDTGAHTGEYDRTDSVISFDFDSGRWAATGVLDGTRLNVEYNAWAALSDMDGGVYALCSPDRSVEAG